MKILSLFFWMLFSANSLALIANEQFSDIQYKDLVTSTQGYISNTSGDGYLVLNNIVLNRAQMCGLQLTLEFEEAPDRATIFDLYWRTEQSSFTESQKSFFIINQADAKSVNSYVVPLCKLFSYSGNLNQPQAQANISAIRLDYPPNKDLSIRIAEIKFLDSLTVSANDFDAIVLEPYERIPAQSFTSFDVIIPKLVFAFEEGLQRLSKDVPFLIFWLLLIFLLKLLMFLSFARQFKADDQ